MGYLFFMIDHSLEFHRNAMPLIPSSDDRHPGVAFYVDGNPHQHFCPCQNSGNKTCAHLKSLFKAIDKKGAYCKSLNLEARFRKSVWHDLATVLSQGDRLEPKTTKARFYKKGDQKLLKVLTPAGKVVITYGSANGDKCRFAERLGALLFGRGSPGPRPGGNHPPPRAVNHDRCGTAAT